MLALLGSGLFMLQVAGCGFTEFNELIQTLLLAVTAAGSYAILQNI